MAEDKDKEAVEAEEGKGKKKEADLPYCTTAPSAEHHRADTDDEPCDDGRGGNV